MPEELHLVSELAIILVAAGIFTIISKALKQPLILGYIVAGFIVGPHLGIFPQFSADEIHEWSELGIIFLLFGLGLEFSFKKLLKIGASAFIAAGVKCLGMFCLGIIFASLMGWTPMEGIFFGGMIGMSSTTIIIKAYDDLKLKDRPYSSLIFGSLVFEDLIAVLLLVLLSTIAVTGKFEGGQMLGAIAKLLFFLILWFVVGIYLLPLFFKKAAKYLNDEILLLVGVGLCFGMVVIANLVGFSSALGAFVMGSLLAETLQGERVAHLMSSVKDLFGAIFFVSVGMMLDPAIVAQHWLTILLIIVVAMSGILVFSTSGVLLAGKGLNTAIHTSFSLAQLGEFGFIIASLGCSLGVMRDFFYPLIIAASVVTTFTTPYMIKLGDPAANWLQRHLPKKILDRIDPPQNGGGRESSAEKSEWRKLLSSLAVRVVIFSVIELAVIIGSGKLLPVIFQKLAPDMSGLSVKWISLAFTLIVSLPFLNGIALSGKTVRAEAGHLIKKNPHNAWGVLAMICCRLAIALIFILQTVTLYFELSWWTVILIVGLGIIFYYFLRRYFHGVSHIENVFMNNLNAKEEKMKASAPVSTRIKEAFAGDAVKLLPVTVSPDFEFVGKTLREMPFRKRSGVNIIKIQRGNRSLNIPSGDEVIYPGDVLLAVGTSEQVSAFASVMIEHTSHEAAADQGQFDVQPVVIGEDSIMAGKSLRELDMRASSCMAVSVLRDGKLYTNPHADFVIELGDTVWVAGEKESVEWYK